ATLSGLVPGWTLITGIVVLLPSVVAGAQYPLLIALLGDGADRVGAHAGRTASFNTIGSVLGALLMGFVALPRLGAVVSWRALAVAMTLRGGSALAAAAMPGRRIGERSSASAEDEGLRWRMRWPRPAAAAATMTALIALGAALGSEGPTAAWRHGAIGVGRTD